MKRKLIRWKDVEYQPGNILAVGRSTVNGKKVEVARHKVETTGKAVALRIEADNAQWKADGEDLQHLRIVAVDSKGRPKSSKHFSIVNSCLCRCLNLFNKPAWQ